MKKTILIKNLKWQDPNVKLLSIEIQIEESLLNDETSPEFIDAVKKEVERIEDDFGSSLYPDFTVDIDYCPNVFSRSGFPDINDLPKDNNPINLNQTFQNSSLHFDMRSSVRIVDLIGMSEADFNQFMFNLQSMRYRFSNNINSYNPSFMENFVRLT